MRNASEQFPKMSSTTTVTTFVPNNFFDVLSTIGPDNGTNSTDVAAEILRRTNLTLADTGEYLKQNQTNNGTTTQTPPQGWVERNLLLAVCITLATVLVVGLIIAALIFVICKYKGKRTEKKLCSMCCCNGSAPSRDTQASAPSDNHVRSRLASPAIDTTRLTQTADTNVRSLPSASKGGASRLPPLDHSMSVQSKGHKALWDPSRPGSMRLKGVPHVNIPPDEAEKLPTFDD